MNFLKNKYLYILVALICIFLIMLFLLLKKPEKNKGVSNKKENVHNVEKCKSFESKAKKDLQQKKAKYYFFGMIPPKGLLAEKLKRNHIEIVLQDNIVDPEVSCYNEVILKNIK